MELIQGMGHRSLGSALPERGCDLGQVPSLHPCSLPSLGIQAGDKARLEQAEWLGEAVEPMTVAERREDKAMN